ncbi:MAG: hypothetical protein K2I90_03555, partial [Odoribacter sp.]|nr:hypothetical protein [Odoribacter sp.]
RHQGGTRTRAGNSTSQLQCRHHPDESEMTFPKKMPVRQNPEIDFAEQAFQHIPVCRQTDSYS